MNDSVHAALSELLRIVVTRCALAGDSTIFGVYRHAPAYFAVPMTGLQAAFGSSVSGSGRDVGDRLEALAQEVKAGRVTDPTDGLFGVGLVLQVDLPPAPIHLLTVVCADQIVHRTGWRPGEGGPRGTIAVPGGPDVSTDPFVRGLTAILTALTGGEGA